MTTAHLALVGALLSGVPQPRVPAAELRAGPTLTVAVGRAEMAVGNQKVVFRTGDKGYSLTTYVRDRGVWREGFEAPEALLKGSLFGDLPTGFTVIANTPSRTCVELVGRHAKPAYDWSLRVSASAKSPLILLRITCRLPDPLMLDSPQPTVALWTRRAEPAVRVDQGPDSIYGSAGIPHGYGFPAAYLWDDRFEAAVFFNMTPMRWMRRDGVARFHDVRIMTRRDGGRIGLGMHSKGLTGRTIPAGDMVIEFSLYQGIRARRPTSLAALDTMMRLFAPLHPASAPWPTDQTTGRPASWDHVATQTLADLMKPGTVAEIAAPWRDRPVELVRPQETMVVHPGAAQPGPEQVAAGWDFSTVNNHLSPWLLLARLRGDRTALALAMRKKDALPRFYDPRAGLIRHGTRQPEHVGDLEMSWQDLYFHQEVLRASSAAGAGGFNPAVAGRFLMAAAGLRELANNVDYVLPQWFDPYRKQPMRQNDLPRLGMVREPWQIGTYAYLMMAAYDTTGDAGYLSEARRAVDTLMERMHYRMTNEVYDRTYAEPGEFPITELFGNASGAVAVHRIYEATGDAKYLRYSRDFLNTLLRLTPWYDDETDAVSRELHSAGLFFPHCGAHVLTPWETAEAHLAIVWVLKHDPTNPLRKLLLKLANLNRTNSFYFYPAFWTAPVRAHDGTSRSGPGMYFPIEPFYSLEGEGGHRGPTAAYMASLGLWNDWMFEAVADTSDRQVMVLNLDAMDDFELSLQGIQRNLLVYNPTSTRRACTLRLSHLTDGQYTVTIGGRSRSMQAARVRSGLPITLEAGAEVRIVLRRGDYREATRRLQGQRECRNAIIRAYAALQQRGAAQPAQVQEFRGALADLDAGRTDRARRRADAVIQGDAIHRLFPGGSKP